MSCFSCPNVWATIFNYAADEKVNELIPGLVHTVMAEFQESESSVAETFCCHCARLFTDATKRKRIPKTNHWQHADVEDCSWPDALNPFQEIEEVIRGKKLSVMIAGGWAAWLHFHEHRQYIHPWRPDGELYHRDLDIFCLQDSALEVDAGLRYGLSFLFPQCSVTKDGPALSHWNTVLNGFRTEETASTRYACHKTRTSRASSLLPLHMKISIDVIASFRKYTRDPLVILSGFDMDWCRVGYLPTKHTPAFAGNVSDNPRKWILHPNHARGKMETPDAEKNLMERHKARVQKYKDRHYPLACCCDSKGILPPTRDDDDSSTIDCVASVFSSMENMLSMKASPRKKRKDYTITPISDDAGYDRKTEEAKWKLIGDNRNVGDKKTRKEEEEHVFSVIESDAQFYAELTKLLPEQYIKLKRILWGDACARGYGRDLKSLVFDVVNQLGSACRSRLGHLMEAALYSVTKQAKTEKVEWPELEHWGQFNAMFVDAPPKQIEDISNIAISLDVGPLVAMAAGSSHVRETNLYNIWVSGYKPPPPSECGDKCCLQ